MPELGKIARALSQYESLERKLHLKELQIKGLLAITQAINDNVSSDGLFAMYGNFLRFEMGVENMALFFQENGIWETKSAYGVAEDLDPELLEQELSRIERATRLDEHKHPYFAQFDIAIPVFHKKEPLAYTFIGGFNDSDDIFNKVQFITTITNVIAVAIENKRLFKKQMQQELVGKELEMASQIQRTLVPSRLPESDAYHLSSIYQPHFAVGGDYFDVVEFQDGKMAFCIADVTGKGMSAALLMANFQASLHSLLHRSLNLEEIVREINSAVYRVTNGDRFVTLFLGKYDPKERSLHFINAGHPPPLLYSNGEVVKLENGCTPIGWMDDLGSIEIGGLCLTKGEAMLFSYTDGIMDIQNSMGEFFDEERIEKFVLSNPNVKPKELNSRLLKALDLFRGNEPFPDDITVLTAQFF